MRPPKRQRNPARKDFPESQQRKKSKKSCTPRTMRRINDNVDSADLAASRPSSVDGNQNSAVANSSHQSTALTFAPRNLSVAHGPVINITSRADQQGSPRSSSEANPAHHDSNQVSGRPLDPGSGFITSTTSSGSLVQTERPQPSPNSYPATPPASAEPGIQQPCGSGQINPGNYVGTFMQPDSFVTDSQGLRTSSEVIYSRLQVSHPPEHIPSVFEPISSHIPIKIKEKVWNGEFIDFNLLLKSNRDLVNESYLKSDLTVRGGTLSVVKKTTTPIKNIHVWSSAFLVYASILLEKWPNKGLELFKYLHSVRLAASRGYPGGWVQYDEQYRLRKAQSPTSSWGIVDMEIWMLCVSTPNNSSLSTGFTNHANIPQAQGNYLSANSREFNFNSPPSRNFCRNFNRGGRCQFGRYCKFSHRCSRCNGNHPITVCRS